ncbi:MAG: carbohydrate ABC transporter permease [Verrucomicrobia bacterium]|nr:carbohydrate ABC transporter permease [Verrucomicrobiota bacterium]
MPNPTPQPVTADAKQSRDARRLRALARILIIYGLLLGGGILFSLPFVWMIGTSFKVDREMFSGKLNLWPMRPIPAQASPYLDSRYFAEPHDAIYPTLETALQETLREHRERLPSHIHNAEDAASILAPGLYLRLRETLPATTWKLPHHALVEEIKTRLTPELIDETIRKVYRHLSFAGVRVRSLDLQEADLTSGHPISDFWSVEGPATLADGKEGATHLADLVYSFPEEKGGEVRLTRTLTLPFPVDRLHRIQLYIRPDDSWHPIDFYVEKQGHVFKGRRPEYTGNFQWTVVSLQDYGPDDESTKIRLWVPMIKQDGLTSNITADNQVKVTLVLRQNDSVGAWWAKVQRNYRGALDYIPFWRYAATSIFLVILNIVGTLFSCSIVAFAFARLQWPGRNLSFGLMMATMMIPGQVTMIPYFLIIKSLGWYNTLTPLWVMSLCGNAFNIFLLHQFMKGIPRDLEDAARIDGCNSWQVYLHVMLPLVKPTLACIAIFTFMGVWNDFMGPLIYLSDQRLYPLSLGLFAFNVQAGGSFGMMMAGSLLMTLPIILIFFFAQKYFIQGVTLTGMKG